MEGWELIKEIANGYIDNCAIEYSSDVFATKRIQVKNGCLLWEPTEFHTGYLTNPKVDFRVVTSLTPKEKAYIANLIEPFKDKVMSISRRCIISVKCISPKIEHSEMVLQIKYRVPYDIATIRIPISSTGDQYTAMQINREYTVKELMEK